MPAPISMASHAIALCTDLTNLKNYNGMPAVQAPLVLIAEERISLLLTYLAEVRTSIGMPSNNLIIQG